jgi:hypothetical protein
MFDEVDVWRTKRALKCFKGDPAVMLHHPADECPNRRRCRVIPTMGYGGSGMMNGRETFVQPARTNTISWHQARKPWAAA